MSKSDLRIMAIALGGCLRGQPAYGITEDTGGHITYILGAMRALADRAEVASAEIVTRMFCDEELGQIHAEPTEQLTAKLSITRIDSGNRQYLAKGDLSADIPAFTARLIAELRSRKHRPDMIHAHFADAAKVAKAVRDALGIPFIYTAHSLAMDKVDAMDAACDTIQERLADETAAIANADAIIGSSRDECERQLMAYPSADETRIQRVRPGIDQRHATDPEMAHACELIAPFLRYPERPIVLAIARPVEKKNLASLVHAFAGSVKLRNSANLVILPGLRQSMECGEPEQVGVVRQLIDAVDAHDLHGSVAFPRKHSASQVRGLYALAAQTGGVFVNPAMTEPFGLTILEAAVHGLPVVATRHGGPADIIGEIEHGTVIDPADHDGIARAIEEYLRNTKKWERASRNALANIGAVKWEHYAAGFLSVADDIFRTAAAPLAGVKPDKLLLCDIDNTLTGCRDAALRFAAFVSGRKDVAFGVATGRSLVEARRLVREWKLPQPAVWVTSVGSEIYWDRADGLEPDVQYRSSIDRGWDADAVTESLAKLGDIEPQAGVDQRDFKRSYFALNDSAAVRARQTLENHGLAARVVHSHDRLLDFLPANAGKGAAMRHVSERLGIEESSVLVAGDSGNDLDMLKAAGNAIVVANCEPALLDLQNRPNVYFADNAFAAGVLEGVVALIGQFDGSVRQSARSEEAA